jgi:hypothetical protein
MSRPVGVHFDLRAIARLEFLEIALDDVDHEAHSTDVYDVDDRCLLGDEGTGSTSRFATKPFTGEMITVFARLMRSSSSRALDCVLCAFARSICATAA